MVMLNDFAKLIALFKESVQLVDLPAQSEKPETLGLKIGRYDLSLLSKESSLSLHSEHA